MRFRCPSCGFSGGVRIPDHLPKGKTVRIRCSRCHKPFPLSVGRLFPQQNPGSYQALAPDSLSCRGSMVGRLWVECSGARQDRNPVIVLPSHPAFSHDVMHDLMDPFCEYFPICYLEFPGTRRNRQGPDHDTYSSIFKDHIDALKQHIGASGFHLLGHLASAAVALDAATSRPDSIRSVILIEPDLRAANHSAWRSLCAKALREVKQDGDGEHLLVSMIQDVWKSNLPQPHALGLAKILSPGFRAEHLEHDLLHSLNELSYARLSRQKTPVLTICSRDGERSSREDACYLTATLPAGERETVEKGGAWAAWLRNDTISGRLLSFKRGAEDGRGASTRLRSRTLNGQALGWMVLVFAVLAAGLTAAAGAFRFQPDYMAAVIPPLLAGVLPILWFVIPRKANPLIFLRFNRFTARSLLLPLLLGAFCGLFYRCLLLTLGTIPIPIPAALISGLPGDAGRLPLLAAVAATALFVFGVAENLWVLRRSRFQVLMPVILFTLLPPAFPDLLWKLPLGFAAAVLFAANLSIYCPLLLLVGFAAVSEAAIPLASLPVYWHSAQGVAVTVALLAAVVILTVFPGTGGKRIPADQIYFTQTINREGRLFRWEMNLGLVMVSFSLIAAAAMIFGFLEI